MGKRPPLRLNCQASREMGTDDCQGKLYLHWPVPRAGWSPEDFQEALGDTGWTLYEIEEDGPTGEACSILACDKCSAIIGEGFAEAPPAPEEVPNA